MTYQERIAQAMRNSGIKNKNSLAKRIGMRPNTITDAFRRLPSRDVLAKIAAALCTSAYWLEHGENEDRVSLQPQQKPPLGITPEFIWREQRVCELAEAIQRYVGAGKAHEISGIAGELCQHAEWLRRRMEGKNCTE